MQIEVKLFANFQVGRFKSEVRQYAAETTVDMILRELGIEGGGCAVVLVDGRVADRDRLLVDGEVLSVVPLVGGG